MQYHLAIDIGASSGRHVLGWLENGKIHLEEVHRFANGMVDRNGALCWNLDTIFDEILAGMKKCAELGKTPVSVGIDTWGVDYVLLDNLGHVLGDTVGYRDARTTDMDAKVYACMPEAELYARTGTQKQIFNTIYQLMAVQQSQPELLKKAERLLMVPDYLHYLLCGVAANEYTDASTTGLINAESKTWDDAIISACGYPRKIFGNLVLPGTRLGSLTDKMRKVVGYSCDVILPGTHDTASAVLAVPSLADDTLYISSGTWSLMGIERMAPDTSEQSFQNNFTNEGGYAYRYRYLKNIMGLWMVQCLRKELDNRHTFAELCDLAAMSDIPSIVDCQDARFLAPPSMMDAVKLACAESAQRIPETAGELAAVIYNSLAVCYGHTVMALERMTGKTYDAIHVVGGGANAAYLNQLTANRTGKTVVAGPTEATAIGNLMAQMLASGEFSDIPTARACVRDSFDVTTYCPQ